MKRKEILLASLLVLAVLTPTTHARVNTVLYWDINGRPNGVYVMDKMVDQIAGLEGRREARFYVAGILDGLRTLDRRILDHLYGDKNSYDEIFNAVETFYKENPKHRAVSVVDVLLTGCNLPKDIM